LSAAPADVTVVVVNNITTEEPTMPKNTTTETAKTDTTTAYEWPKDPHTVLVEYLHARTSADPDAPNRRLPFVTNGVLRVHPSDWLAYLVDASVPAPKRAALTVLKDAGLVQKVYAIPGEDGRSAGFYTGAVPAGAGQLPERVVERADGRARNPFGRLTGEQRTLLVKALGKLNAAGDRELRDQLLVHLEPAETA
jgi:hypothetical protein